MIQLHRLEGFYWVAKTQGYARAARAFPYPITQPGVHQQVKKLEADVGLALFERVGKDKVVLTPAGRALYDFTAPFLEQLPSVVAALRTGAVAGRLRVVAAGLFLRNVLPTWLRRLQAKHPDVEVELGELTTADLSLLRSGEADLLVDFLPSVPSDIEVRVLGKVYPFVAIPSNHPLAKDEHVSISQLKETPFIAYNADRALRELQLKALSSHGLTPKIAASADSSDTILGFVAAGLGFSLVPSLSDKGPRLPGVVAHRLTRPAAEFPIYAAWRKSAAGNRLINAALELAPSPSGG
jgi:DNA-binding transcriptional LysR family regulator